MVGTGMFKWVCLFIFFILGFLIFICGDDKMSVFADGNLIVSETMSWDRKETHQIPSVTRVLAINGTNDDLFACGMWFDSSIGLRTDTTWKCTNVWHNGWENIDYDASGWPWAAWCTDAYRVSHGFPEPPMWIWSTGCANEQYAYCRKVI